MHPERHFQVACERERITALYARQPGSITALLIGVLLSFVFLMSATRPELLKAWAAFMLTTLALRTWLWHQFRTSLVEAAHLGRWEWAYALGMGLTGLGWAALCGPLFPGVASLQNFIWVMLIVIAYSGMVATAPSRPAFLLFVMPTLIPGLLRYVELNGTTLPTLTIACACLAVIVIMHDGLRKSFVEHLGKRVEAEQLLAEQQAIFQNATVGIAVFDGTTLIKCNPRFGELFGRSLRASSELQTTDFFAVADEAQRFTDWSHVELDAGRAVHSMERMRRADGSQFWAELSGRRMHYGHSERNLWLISEVATPSAHSASTTAMSHGHR